MRKTIEEEEVAERKMVTLTFAVSEDLHSAACSQNGFVEIGAFELIIPSGKRDLCASY